MKRQEFTFLQCRNTGKVSFGGGGWVFWHPCEDCGWNNNHPTERVTEHYQVHKVVVTGKESKELYKTSESFSTWVRGMEEKIMKEPK